jgi:beta-phosphoglucomutase-like phosphatase (HAD superfamily)
MAVASGGDRVLVEATLDSLKLRHFFEAIVSRNDLDRGTPAPNLFLLTSQRLGVDLHNCIVHEDSDGGLEVVQKAGMCSVDILIVWQTQE